MQGENVVPLLSAAGGLDIQEESRLLRSPCGGAAAVREGARQNTVVLLILCLSKSYTATLYM